MALIDTPTTATYYPTAGFCKNPQPKLGPNNASGGGLNIVTGFERRGVGVRTQALQQWPRPVFRVNQDVTDLFQTNMIAARTTITYITPTTVANGTTVTDQVALGKGFYLIRLTTSVACRVTLYATAASRTADQTAARAFSTPPTPGQGIIADFLTTTPNQTIVVAPTVLGFNADSPATTTIYLAVTNTSGSTAQIVVTFVRAIAEV